MPLIQGHTQKSISENIRRLIKEGKSQAQAKAIAMATAKRAKQKAKKNGR
jgi:glutamate-1-semialdehyde aminotransferase